MFCESIIHFSSVEVQTAMSSSNCHVVFTASAWDHNMQALASSYFCSASAVKPWRLNLISFFLRTVFHTYSGLSLSFVCLINKRFNGGKAHEQSARTRSHEMHLKLSAGEIMKLKQFYKTPCSPPVCTHRTGLTYSSFTHVYKALFYL